MDAASDHNRPGAVGSIRHLEGSGVPRCSRLSKTVGMKNAVESFKRRLRLAHKT